MRFIKWYNENPFKIHPENQDQVSVVIDKDVYNISFDRLECEKSILLFNTKKALFFQVYFPEPSRRFTMASCVLYGDTLHIKHNRLDLYTNETVDDTEYNWTLNIQPEVKKLIIQLIENAICIAQ